MWKQNTLNQSAKKIRIHKKMKLQDIDHRKRFISLPSSPVKPRNLTSVFEIGKIDLLH